VSRCRITRSNPAKRRCERQGKKLPEFLSASFASLRVAVVDPPDSLARRVHHDSETVNLGVVPFSRLAFPHSIAAELSDF
jgi:hypothetical protein